MQYEQEKHKNEIKVLADTIKRHCPNAKENEVQLICDIFELKHLVKGDIIKKSDKQIPFINFLISGSVRFFVISKKGDETTYRIVDYPTFVDDKLFRDFKNMPTMTIECIEKCTILEAKSSDFKRLLNSNLTLNIFLRNIMMEEVADFMNSILSFFSEEADGRYKQLMEKYPHYLKNHPLKYIASMIGITPTQLSRIRKKK